jgi:rhodanese-related sulfurtransferase
MLYYHKKEEAMGKRHFLELGLILLMTFIIALSYNMLSDSGISLMAEPLSLEPGMELTLEQAYKIFKNGDAIFVDSRSTYAYEKGHIKNAIHISTQSRLEDVKRLLSVYQEDQKLVVYCSGSSCSSSRRLSKKIMQVGYPNVYVFYGGWYEWSRAEYPIEGTDHAGSKKRHDENKD